MEIKSTKVELYKIHHGHYNGQDKHLQCMNGVSCLAISYYIIAINNSCQKILNWKIHLWLIIYVFNFVKAWKFPFLMRVALKYCAGAVSRTWATR